MRARGVHQVIVATDDSRIQEAATGFGAHVEMTSAAHPSGTDRCAEVAKKHPETTHFINVQGDEPLIDPKLISRLARHLAAEPGLEMITAATPFSEDEPVENPNAVKVVLNRFKDALYFSRSPMPFVRDTGKRAGYLRHLGIYGYSRTFLLRFVRWKPGTLETLECLEQLRALENGTKIRVLETQSASIGVDTPSDAVLAEKLLKK
ncbi:MAG: hypothetical protein RLZZ253_1455 [Verrucomicrobiota bacterium]